ncbi:septum formation family protein [Paenarthrobacter nitroguajacolicus]|uniref:septum formation family protein n=1 Tax=Paenarthrobacter nitroguajacolicus TaxID=211146 RepID=UPI003ADA4A51
MRRNLTLPLLPGVTRTAVVAAALALLVALAGCASGVAGPAGADAENVSAESSAELDQCHVITTQEEYAAPSDSRPPVNCSEPHTSQTFLVTTFPEPLASQMERPLQEQLRNATNRLCPADELRKYLGGAPRDATTGMTIAGYYPSRAEWAAGSRAVRCDVLLTSKTGAPQQSTRSLKGALAGPDSAHIRLCYSQGIKDGVLSAEGTDTSCSEPHTAEDVSAWIGQDASLVSLAAQQERCLPFVLEFLNAEVLPEDKEVRPIVRVDGGARAIRCAVAPKQVVPAAWTGTLARARGASSGAAVG